MNDNFIAGLFGLLGLTVSLALIATLVRNAGGTAQIIQAGASGWSEILRSASGNA